MYLVCVDSYALDWALSSGAFVLRGTGFDGEWGWGLF